MRYILVLFLFISQNCLAKDFGNLGVIFEIQEQDMLEYIKSKLEGMQANFDAINKDMQKKAESYVRRPKAVLGIKKADKTQSRLFDPSYILDKDILLPDGRVLHEAGKKVNPLEFIAMPSELYFIDSDDEKQIEWMKLKLKTSRKLYKIILINGDYVKASKHLGVKVYFDQGGMISKKLGISAVPSLVRQKFDKLEILEEKL